jgi:hypothetical protein
LGLTDGHFRGSNVGNGFEKVSILKARLLRGAIWKDGDNDNVAEALGEEDADLAFGFIVQLAPILGEFARAEIAGLRIERIEKAVERAGSDHMNIRLVDIVVLDVLKDFAVYGESRIGIVVVAFALDVAQGDVGKNQN